MSENTESGHEAFDYNKPTVENNVDQGSGNEQLNDKELILFLTNENMRLNDELKATKEALANKERESLTDELTKCGNLRAYNKWADKHHPENLVHQYNKIALVYFDLNKLKYANDNYGHKNAGDVLLLETVKLIREYFFDEDEVYRIGGDEFVLVCHNSSLIDNFEEMINNKVQKIKEIAKSKVFHFDNGKEGILHREEDVELSFSTGVAVVSPSDYSLEDVNSRAEKTMYEDKEDHKRQEKYIKFQ